ncbi:MAG: toll/interleukin-1 receptor domain-containing protein, partial [Anaerolineae bacterium]
MRIFVSYSSRNRPQVKALVQDLENTGHDVWYDQEAAGGHEWWADILENIRACELFIFALTPESLDSEACRWEYRYAHALHKRILPVRLNKEVNPASLTIELQKINFVDYFSGAEQEYRQLVRAITSLRPPVPMPEPMPDEPPVPISPLGELREKIAARSIGVETQTYLVFELKQHVEKAATRAEALALLQRLQSHPDMRVGVANEIKTIITPYIPRKLPETPPTSARIWPTRRMMAGGLVGLVAIGVVVALVILLSGGDEGDREKQTDAGDQTEAALDLTDTPTQTPSPTKQISSTNTTTATQRPSETSTPTSRATSTNTATNTYTPTLTPSATNTPSQTATITPTPTATLPSGFEKVTSNAQWKEMGGPIERDFDGVM